MDPAKVKFLFGSVPAGVDIDDPDVRAELVALDDEQAASAGRLATRAIVTGQIIGEDPPQVWATAQRLLAGGADRREIMTQLSMALGFAVRSGAEDIGPVIDPDVYQHALGWLPLPDPDGIEAAALEFVRGGTAVSHDDLLRFIRGRLGRVDGDELGETIVERVLDRLSDGDGPLALLVGNRVVHVADLTAGVVLTHRLTAAEREHDSLSAGFDLAGFGRREDLCLADRGPLDVFGTGLDEVHWHGPPGWLQAYQPGTVLAVRVDGDGLVSMESLAEEPPLDAELVSRLRSVYDTEVAEPWLPVAAEDLVLGMLAVDRDIFDQPHPPLDDLCVAAGLERRGLEVAHEDSVWDSLVTIRRLRRVFDAFDGTHQRRAAAAIFDLVADEERSPEALRQALDDLDDPELAEVVVEELLDEQDEEAAAFVDGLLAVAATPRQVGVARWVAARFAEDAGEVLVADAHLRLALEADPSSAVIIERCAWYASDRGNAAEAVRLWHLLEDDEEEDSGDLRMVEPFARRFGPKLGRNEPCWCGSGRKYKMCHPRQPPPVPLPERVAWLAHKPSAYLQHVGSDALETLLSLAAIRADSEDPEDLLDALRDPIVIDAALTEGGWFERFLEDREPLLPDDEALLAAAWVLVARSVYEVLEVTPGVGLRVRDVATGDRLDVRERTFSRLAQPEMFVCARAVPDGQSQQFVGAVFPVPPGRERQVLELCDRGDPEEICQYVGALFRPPRMQTREAEPMVECQVVLEVPDPAVTSAALDRRYRRHGEGWVEMHALDGGEEILRATLSLTGSQLTVATYSEPRVERVLEVVRHELPGSRIVSDNRTPLAPGTLPSALRGASADEPPDTDTMTAIQDFIEQRWVDESVPALDGLTPRQASQDPTRRDDLRRLIASFPTPEDLPAGALTLRPDRLRQLLGIRGKE